MATQESQQIGFVINQKFLSFIIAFVTLITILASGVSIVNNYSFRIEQLEKQNALLVSEISGLNRKIDTLSDKIVDLTIALNRVDDRTAGQ